MNALNWPNELSWLIVAAAVTTSAWMLFRPIASDARFGSNSLAATRVTFYLQGFVAAIYSVSGPSGAWIAAGWLLAAALTWGRIRAYKKLVNELVEGEPR